MTAAQAQALLDGATTGCPKCEGAGEVETGVEAFGCVEMMTCDYCCGYGNGENELRAAAPELAAEVVRLTRLVALARSFVACKENETADDREGIDAEAQAETDAYEALRSALGMSP